MKTRKITCTIEITVEDTPEAAGITADFLNDDDGYLAEELRSTVAASLGFAADITTEFKE